MKLDSIPELLEGKHPTDMLQRLHNIVPQGTTNAIDSRGTEMPIEGAKFVTISSCVARSIALPIPVLYYLCFNSSSSNSSTPDAVAHER